VPKIIDHEKRREDIIDATWQVIAREGLANTTTRKISKEAGFASSLLAHYFPEKEAILESALAAAFDKAIKRVLASINAHTGMEALRQSLLVCLPFNKDRRLEVEVLINFWGHQLGDANHTARQYKNYQQWSRLVQKLIKAAQQSGEIRADVNVKSSSDMLLGIVDGLSAQATLYPKYFSAKRQTAAIDMALEALK